MLKKPLQFNKNGKFKIAQITDIHGICKKTPDTTRLIEGVLDQEKPDLVVFTGDQIKGYGLSYLHGDKKKKVQQAINNYTEPVNSRNIPFLVTFGNHDPQVGISLEEQLKSYLQFENCIHVEGKEAFAPGTCSVPILKSDGSEAAFNVYVIESGTNNKEIGYDSVGEDVLNWYRSVRDGLHEQYGKYIPSMIFQHIPVQEIYNLYDRVEKKDEDAVKAYRIHNNEYYRLKKEFAKGDAKLYEPSAVSDINTGEFDAIKEKGDVIAMLFGHDHKNNFVGTYDGVDMGYGPSCSFNEYGMGVERGIRIIELDENDIRNYETKVVTYRQLFGEKVKKPFQKWFYDQIPTSRDAAIPFVFKCVGLAAAVVALIVCLVKYL